MITEIAQIDVKPGTEAEFEKGVKQAIPIFKRAKGCRSMELRRSIEKPSRYRLFVGWDTVENHVMSRLRSSMTAAGAPAGAQTPSHPERMKLIPASATVGTSGNTSSGSGLLTARI